MKNLRHQACSMSSLSDLSKSKHTEPNLKAGDMYIYIYMIYTSTYLQECHTYDLAGKLKQ